MTIRARQNKRSKRILRTAVTHSLLLLLASCFSIIARRSRRSLRKPTRLSAALAVQALSLPATTPRWTPSCMSTRLRRARRSWCDASACWDCHRNRRCDCDASMRSVEREDPSHSHRAYHPQASSAELDSRSRSRLRTTLARLNLSSHRRSAARVRRIARHRHSTSVAPLLPLCRTCRLLLLRSRHSHLRPHPLRRRLLRPRQLVCLSCLVLAVRSDMCASVLRP